MPSTYYVLCVQLTRYLFAIAKFLLVFIAHQNITCDIVIAILYICPSVTHRYSVETA